MAAIIALALVGLAAYGNSLNGPFVYDDTNIILSNSLIKDLSNFIALPWPRYLAHLTFAVNYAIGGFDVFGYHLLNVAIHIANAALVYCLASQLMRLKGLGDDTKDFPKAYIPLSVSMVFLVHPVNTGAVSYITQRFTLLAAFFYLSTVVLYLKSRSSLENGSEYYRPRFYWGAIVTTILGQFTKENCFTIPLMLAAIEFGFFNGAIKKRIFRLLPFFSLFIIAPLALITPALFSNEEFLTALSKDQTLRQLTYVSPYGYILTQFRVAVTYLRLLFYPTGLRIAYDYPVYDTFFVPQVYLSFIFLCALLAAAIFLLVRAKRSAHTLPQLFSFGILWFFIANIVEALTPLRDVIFEHRAYLPSVGIIISFFSLYSYSAIKLSGKARSSTNASRTLWITSALIAMVFAISTHKRNEVWTDGFKFWQDSATKAPASFTAVSNLGSEYVLLGNYDKAIELYRVALPLAKPYDRTLAYDKLASTLLLAGKYDESIALNLEAMKFTDNPAKTLLGLGFAFAAKKEYKRAISTYNEVISLNPELNTRASAHEGIGNVLVETKRYDEAIAYLSRAIALNPQVSDYHYNLAGAYLLKGDKGKALVYFK
ncbi:MAG: tetratricopeptide repeat protein, partial [Nitrospirota bacterium]|nr:tetratricopeptide repeat protein [Nitrospirota bacterium]